MPRENHAPKETRRNVVKTITMGVAVAASSAALSPVAWSYLSERQSGCLCSDEEYVIVNGWLLSANDLRRAGWKKS